MNRPHHRTACVCGRTCKMTGVDIGWQLMEEDLTTGIHRILIRVGGRPTQWIGIGIACKGNPVAILWDRKVHW